MPCKVMLPVRAVVPTLPKRPRHQTLSASHSSLNTVAASGPATVDVWSTRRNTNFSETHWQSIYAPDRYTIRLTLKVSWRGSAGHLGSAFVLPPFCTHVQFAGLLFLTAMYQYNECLRANFTTRHCICASPHLYMMRDTDTANIDSLTKAR
jgi:hypothetical protein